jgi:hypothetical protein
MSNCINEDPIYVITPCSRPENLRQIERTFHICFQARDRMNNLVNWIIVHDADEIPAGLFNEEGILHLNIKGGVVGKLQINHALDYLQEHEMPGWIYVLDDDNAVHHNFMNEIMCQFMEDAGRYFAYVFDQQLEGGTVREVDMDNIAPCFIDQAQYIIHTKLIQNLRYEQFYEADGKFIQMLYSEYKELFAQIKKTLSFYNRLKWQ